MKQNLYIMKEGIVLLLTINNGTYGEYGYCLFYEEIRQYRLTGSSKGARVILSKSKYDGYFGDVFLTPL
jgi:hypothetical protein